MYPYMPRGTFCGFSNEQVDCLHVHAIHCRDHVSKWFFNYFFLYNLECPNQFTCIITNFQGHWTSCKSSKHVRHRENDRHTQRGSNPGTKKKQVISPTRPRSQMPCYHMIDLMWLICYNYQFNLIYIFLLF
jgi:hypothetical protein